MTKSSSPLRFALLLVLALVAICATLSVVTLPAAADADALVVRTSYGKIRGTTLNDGKTAAFLGIPFAAPPTGVRRFASPVQPQPWHSQELDATQFKPICMQSSSVPAGFTMSEDCLYLNVYAPMDHFLGDDHERDEDPAKLPVMAFIHGGRYWTGRSSENNGAFLAPHGRVIVVTIAYRLNIFGFLASDKQQETGELNIGIQDQQFALQWIRRNIGRFGGDSSKITIFGESAGAGSVMNHLLTPWSSGLFRNAILQSTWQWILPTLDQGKTASKNVAIAQGCPTDTDDAMLECLRSKPASAILPTLGGSHHFQPQVEGRMLRAQPLDLIREGWFNRNANIILGNVAKEGNFMALSRSGFRQPTVPVPDATYYSAINAALLPYYTQDQVNEILTWYEPTRAQIGNWYTLSKLFGEFYLYCGSFEAAKLFSQFSNKPVHTFWFDHLSANDPEPYLGATHGNELDFVFNSTVYAPTYPFTAQDVAISERMMSSWASIAYTGSPSAKSTTGSPDWTAFNPAAPQAYVWQQPSTGAYVPYQPSDDICAKWLNILQ